MPGTSESTVRAVNEPGRKAVPRPTDVLHFAQCPCLELAVNEVQRHPAETNAHQERLFLRIMARKIEGALAAKQVAVKSLFLTRVLHGKLDVLLQLRQRHALRLRERVRTSRTQDAVHRRKRFLEQIRTGGVVRDQHQVPVFFLEARLNASQELHLDLNFGRYTCRGERSHRRECRVEWQDAVDDDCQRRFPFLGELPRN